MFKKLILLIVFLLMPALGYSISRVVGGGAVEDNSMNLIPACTSFGFSITNTKVLPTGFNIGRFVRVSKTKESSVGFLLTGDSTTLRILSFDLDTLSTLNSATVVAACGVGAKYNCDASLVGDVESSTGNLYLFRKARNGSAFCSGGAGGDCISFARINSMTLAETEVITAPDASSNLDDARDNGTGSFVLINANSITSLREFKQFSKLTLTQTATGTSFGLSAFGHLSNPFNGKMYGVLGSTSATSGLRIPVGSVTSDGTFSFSGSMGTRLPAAIYTAITDFGGSENEILGESDVTGTTPAVRGYVVESTLVNCCTRTYAASSLDGEATRQGTFWDSIDNKVYSTRFRSSDSSIRFLRTITGPITAIDPVEENFICGSCGSSSPGGTQAVDYAPQKKSLYFLSGGSPATLVKIRACT